MKLSIYNFRNLHLALIFFLWLFLILYNERLLSDKYSGRCHWPRDNGYNLLLVSDPQLIDEHTYPYRPWPLLKLSQHVTNNYLYKNFRSIVNLLHPESVVFIGDYLDNGRLDFEDQRKWSNSRNYDKELAKFRLIFGKDVLTNVPGNHDIGWENGVTLEAIERFHKNFGPTNIAVEKGPFELVLLDSLSLSNNINETIFGPPRAFLEKLGAEVKRKPRILLTHVPLWKDHPGRCGPQRESSTFPITKGFQYQTVLTKELSEELLNKIKPDLIFSGDDHDYCEYTHLDSTGGNVTEITVKSISMAMGIKRPAVELLTLYNDPVDSQHRAQYNICYLPKPYDEVIIYGSLAFVTVVILTFVVLMRTSSISLVLRKNNMYTNEEPVSYHRLTSYLQSAEAQEVDLNATSDLRGSYTYHTTNFTEAANRKKNYTRFNWVLLLRHGLLLFLSVSVVYWIFVKEVVLL